MGEVHLRKYRVNQLPTPINQIPGELYVIAEALQSLQDTITELNQ